MNHAYWSHGLLGYRRDFVLEECEYKNIHHKILARSTTDNITHQSERSITSQILSRISAMSEQVLRTAASAAPQASMTSNAEGKTVIDLTKDDEPMDLTGDSPVIDLREGLSIIDPNEAIETIDLTEEVEHESTCVIFIEIIHSDKYKRLKGQFIKTLLGPYIDNGLHHGMIVDDIQKLIIAPYEKDYVGCSDFAWPAVEAAYNKLLKEGSVSIERKLQLEGDVCFWVRLVMHSHCKQENTIQMLEDLDSGKTPWVRMYVVVARYRNGSGVPKKPFFTRHGTSLFITDQNENDQCDNIQAFVDRQEAMDYMRVRLMKSKSDFTEAEKNNKVFTVERYVDLDGTTKLIDNGQLFHVTLSQWVVQRRGRVERRMP